MDTFVDGVGGVAVEDGEFGEVRNGRGSCFLGCFTASDVARSRFAME